MTASRKDVVTIDVLDDVADLQRDIVVDGGVENYNAAVEEAVNSGVLKRVLAQTEIRSSNSWIESCRRVLKHPWLYLNQLEKRVEFYVEQHNAHLPHSAFQAGHPQPASDTPPGKWRA